MAETIHTVAARNAVVALIAASAGYRVCHRSSRLRSQMWGPPPAFAKATADHRSFSVGGQAAWAG